MKFIYLVMSESRVRGSETAFDCKMPICANELKEDSEKDAAKWNELSKVQGNDYLEFHYYVEELKLFESSKEKE